MEGTRWMLEEETEESVCEQGKSYVVGLPLNLDIHEAMGICRRKLDNSIMPVQEDFESLYTISIWYFNFTRGFCFNIWTPFSDKKEKGVFVNMFDNSKANFLPWDISEPTNGTNEIYVTISYPSGRNRHSTAKPESAVCSSCLLDRSLMLQMDGHCEDTFMGDQIDF